MKIFDLEMNFITVNKIGDIFYFKLEKLLKFFFKDINGRKFFY